MKLTRRRLPCGSAATSTTPPSGASNPRPPPTSKWVSADAYDPQIAADIAACGSFDEVAKILSLYDEAGSGIGFLDMLDQGYFA
jgi:hypothetical protein